MKVAKKKVDEAVEVEEQNGGNPEEQEMTDEEIAETANRMIKEKDREIADLKKKLAKQALIYAAPDEEDESMSKEDCLKVIGDPNALNYDFAVAVVNLHNNCVENGENSPLGEHGEEIAQLFADIIDRCDGDKTVFPSVYQSMVPADDKQVATAWNKRYGKH